MTTRRSRALNFIRTFLFIMLFLLTCSSAGDRSLAEISPQVIKAPVEPYGDLAEDLVPADRLTDTTIEIIMAGDILLHSKLLQNCRASDGSYDLNSIFNGTRNIIQNADVSIVNQEVIIGGKELGISGYPEFNAPFETADALHDAGFNVICHATNHSMDRRKQGILSCLENWRRFPDVKVTGIYDSEEASEEICVIEKNGIRTAILNYTFGTNYITVPEDFSYGINLLTEDKVQKDLEKAKAQADFIIICPHWGIEYAHEINESQKNWTRFFLENGVDAVIGTHPHVIQPVEMLTDEKTGHQMLVFYSLGNFVNWTGNTGLNCANQCVGGLAYIKLDKAKDGTVRIAGHNILPTVCHLTKGQDGVNVYLLDDYTPELAMKNEIRLQEPAFSYEYCLDLTGRIWPRYMDLQDR